MSEPVLESVEWQGERFFIADRIGLAPLLRFAKVAKQGTDSDDMDGLVAMHDLLEQCFVEKPYCASCLSTDAEQLVAPDPADGAVDGRCCPDRKLVSVEFDRWMDHAAKVRADTDGILELVKLVMDVLTARPTRRPSDSSSGPSTALQRREPASSSLQVQQRFESAGRPDLALIVANVREAEARRTA